MLIKLVKILKKNKALYRVGIHIYTIILGLRGFLKKKRGSINYLKNTFSYIRRSAYITGRPINITIEPSNRCNCQCPICETGAGILGRPNQNMKLEDFRTVIDKISKHTNTLMFYFMGEPFFNKDSYKMIRYAKDQGIPFITTCTNGDLVDPVKLVECGIDEVSFQIGGITQESHEKYRKGSNLERVMFNLRETVRLRNEMNIDLHIVSGFILMKHNEHEVDEFKLTMKNLGIDEAIIIDPCVRTIEQGRDMLPSDKSHWIYDPNAFEEGKLVPKTLSNNECPWIYYSMTILVNGDVVPCCRDPHGNYIMGNIISQDLDEIWNNFFF